MGVADLWGCFNGQGLGTFHDIGELTIFADYRVPQILVGLGAIRYTDELTSALQRGDDVPPGSEREMQIRAASIHSVECIRQHMRTVLETTANLNHRMTEPSSVEIDFYLWETAKKEA